jgi:hypothetical protein
MRGAHVTFFPQYCPEPINDLAWYPGFKDWDLIANLPGSMQQRFRPAAGFYDLSSVKDIAAQFEALASSRWPAMALYHYFFDGKFALQEVEKFILSGAGFVPEFFVIWANESWTKRWVGKANEFIIKQHHSIDELTIATHVDRLCKLFEHPSYRKWNGRPVFVFYAVYDVQNLSAVLEAYKDAFSRRSVYPLVGFCVPYVDPGFDPSGFDFCVEFQPRLFFNVMRALKIPKSTKMALLLKNAVPWLYDALISVRDRRTRARMTPRETYMYGEYLALLERDAFAVLLEKAYRLPVVRCIFYSWNNFPRYRGAAVIVEHAEGDFERFLEINRRLSEAGSWFLVNSWNEWSEGAALEPGVVSPGLFDLTGV